MTPAFASVTQPTFSETSSTVGNLALKIFEKQFSKFVKWESEVLADVDPEPLHQMRVGTRRLRTALQLFQPFILVKPSLSREVAQVTKRLGTVRDLDVLKLRLQACQAQPSYALEEQAQLHLLIHRLDRLRQKQFKRLAKTLTGSRYVRLIHQCHAWFDAPQFPIAAQWQAAAALPDLLMPFIHEWLRHPAWLVEAPTGEGSKVSKDGIDPNAMFHDLRKLTKQVRYQTELFTGFYGSELSAYVDELKAIQELLGEQQDNVVFAAFLQKMLGTQWQSKVPSLAETLRQSQQSFPAQWQPFREAYLSPEVRHERRSLFLNPVSS
jgi:CHAD domain-containing protein